MTDWFLRDLELQCSRLREESRAIGRESSEAERKLIGELEARIREHREMMRS